MERSDLNRRDGSVERKSGRHRSALQLRPEVSWPTLTDATSDIKRFWQDLEATIMLCNDGSSLGDREKLQVMKIALKQSFAEVY